MSERKERIGARGEVRIGVKGRAREVGARWKVLDQPNTQPDRCVEHE